MKRWGIFTFIFTVSVMLIFLISNCGGGNGNGVPGPTVSLTSPSDGAAGIQLDADITITFSEAMDQASVEANLSIYPDPGAVGHSWAGTTLTVDPYSLLADSVTYSVTIGGACQDTEGTAMGSPYNFGFTTVARPRVTTSIPAQGDTSVSTAADVTITFSRNMEQTSAENAVSISGYSGSLSFNWTSGNVVEVSMAPYLDADTRYTVSVAGSAEDANNLSMGASYNLTFSTGSLLAGVSVSGTVFDDPDSIYDDNLTGTAVALMDGPPWEGEPLHELATGYDGTYQFSYVENGNYYPVAFKDTNPEDWGLHPRFGDALGEWPDRPAEALTITGTDRTGINLYLRDPEAISGQVSYSGAYSSQIGELWNSLRVFAYAGTGIASRSEMTLASSPEPGVMYTVAGDFVGDTWVYGLNPYLMPVLSVSGKFADDNTVTQTGMDRIPKDGYQILAFLQLPSYIKSEERLLVGFAENLAEISGTGDDEGWVNIILHDTKQDLPIEFSLRTPTDQVGFTGGRVTLLGWPLDIVTEYACFSIWCEYGFMGEYSEFEHIPYDVPFAIHIQPKGEDLPTRMPANSSYMVFPFAPVDSYNHNTEFVVVNRAMADIMAAAADTVIDPMRALVYGNIQWDPDSDLLLEGVTATISTGDEAHYLYSDFSMGAPYTQEDAQPQFVFFNVEPTADGKAIISLSHSEPAYSFDPVVIPLRAGEITVLEWPPGPN